MRASWKGSITFGLVTIPVKVYTAILPKELKFSLLHSADGGRIRYKKVCEKCGKEVSNDEIVRGYEISKNEYVILTDEDFEKVPLKTVKSIEIKQFFDPSELGVIYYSNFYYVSPDKGGEKAYYLLKRAMSETGSMAIGKMGMRGKEHLIALKAFDGGLLLTQLHYIDEIRSPAEVPGWGIEIEVSEEELELAKKLVIAMKKPLKLEEYRDEYKEALMELIEAKLAGREVTVTEGVEEVKSLMDALKASLEAVKEA
ncbi:MULTISPECIES: Ku protein [unclassified Archaeoglobus]|jgi:DNA end-binding protein Ku|uniref:non-homologous end joining protein Ku n=1 Tax=unclassified Archaeoglobus TaxID=2643606 RepID=UPI0025C28948|nr:MULTISPECIES: Ku protein [unclassified Archaeoglobus]